MRLVIMTAAMLAGVAPAIAQGMSGEQVAQAYADCAEQAQANCGRSTIRCNAYRREFVKVCLIRRGVPPEYIGALLD